MHSLPIRVGRARSRSRSVPFAFLLSAAAICALFASCSDDAGGRADGPPGGLVQRPRIGPVKAPAALPDARMEALAFPPEILPWEVQAGGAELIETSEKRGEPPRIGLELRGRGPKRILIPGPFEADAFNRLLLEVRVWDPTNFTVQLVRDGVGVLGSETASIGLSREVQPVAIDLPHTRTRTEPIDAIRILINSRGIMRIDGITLVQQPVEAWLPRANDEERLIEIADESRSARGLTSAIPWTGSAKVPAGGELSFSYGVPRYLHLSNSVHPELVVTVSSGRRRDIVERFKLDDHPGQPAWRGARIGLERLAGREVELRFELEVPAGTRPELLALCALGEVRIVARGADPRTVLLVTSDTHRADYMGLAGLGIDVRTPNLDALAERGVLFEDCFAATNITNPSHISLMTAVHPRDIGILDNTSAVSSQAQTLAEHFRDAGYITFAAISTRHLGDDVSGLGQGFDRMSWPYLGGDRDGKDTIEVIERWLPEAEGAPLFVWLHAFDPHSPYAPPEEYGNLYYDPDKDAFDPDLPPPPEEPFLPTFLAGLRDLAYPEAMYRGEISYLDNSLASLFDRPRFREGIVAFTSDHGESLGQHGIYFDHGDLYPDTIHVPLILAWPGGPQGVRVSEPVQLLDLGRTLLDLAGLQQLEFPGTDLRAYIAGEGPAGPRFTLAGNYASAAMTWRGKHLILHLRAHAERNRAEAAPRHQVELYDMNVDPGCTHDLVEEELELAKQMRGLLLRWLGDAQDLGWAMEANRDSALLAQLAALGYTDDGGGSSLSKYYDPDCTCEWCQRFE